METTELMNRARRMGTTDQGRPAPYQLARLAEVSDPENLSSPGSAFLLDVFETWIERAEPFDGGEPDYRTEEGRESIARDVATIHEGMSEWECWRAFVDLALVNDEETVEVWASSMYAGTLSDIMKTNPLRTVSEGVQNLARIGVEVVAHRLAETLTRHLLTIEGKR